MNISIENLDDLCTKQNELKIEKKRLQTDSKKSRHKSHKYKQKNHKHGYKKHKTNSNHIFTQLYNIKKEMIVNDKKIHLLESELQKRNIN